MSILPDADPPRLAQMREHAAAVVEQAGWLVNNLQGRLDRAVAQKAQAEQELAYWTSVRDPDEMLQMCLQELKTGEAFVMRDDGKMVVHNVPAVRQVRDGIEIWVCMAQRPCPIHGRPLGDSDWRLHPTGTQPHGDRA